MRTTKQASLPGKDAILDYIPSEKTLAAKERTANIFVVIMLLIGALLILINVVQTINTDFFQPSPLVPLAVLIPVLLALGVCMGIGIANSKKYSDLRRYLYKEVQVGVIEKLIFDDDNRHAGVRLAVVKGKNRAGGVVYQEVSIPAKQVNTRTFYLGQQLKL